MGSFLCIIQENVFSLLMTSLIRLKHVAALNTYIFSCVDCYYVVILFYFIFDASVTQNFILKVDNFSVCLQFPYLVTSQFRKW